MCSNLGKVKAIYFYDPKIGGEKIRFENKEIEKEYTHTFTGTLKRDIEAYNKVMESLHKNSTMLFLRTEEEE